MTRTARAAMPCRAPVTSIYAARVSHRLAFVVLMLTLLLAACGGSTAASETGRSSTIASVPAATRTLSTTRAATTPRTVPAGATASSTSTRTSSSPRTSRTSPTPDATHARLPATFTILGGGRLAPASILAPASLTIELTVISADGHAHGVLVRRPRPYPFEVPAKSRTSVLISGLRAGRYAIDVDGAERGALIVGGQPGP